MSRQFITCLSGEQRPLHAHRRTLVAVDAIDSIETEIYGVNPGFAEGKITFRLRNGDEVIYFEVRNTSSVGDPEELYSEIQDSIHEAAWLLLAQFQREYDQVKKGQAAEMAGVAYAE